MRLDSSTTVLITGANGGLGAAIARECARRGAKLVLSGRRREAVEPLAEELGARVVVADLAHTADAARLVREAGDVDVAVLNAAHPASGQLDTFDDAEVERIVRINLTAPVITAKALVPGMVGRGRGQLVFISSVAGLVANPGASLYNATKFGLRGFALALRADLQEAHVGVTTIYPGFIRDAGMFAASGAKLPAGVGTRSPEDVARAVARAVEKNPAEIVVAAADQRIGAFFGGLFPSLVDAFSRSAAVKRIAADVAAGQRESMRDRLR